MWQSTETPEVSFFRLAGIALVVLALAAGCISLIGLTLAKPEPQLLAQQAAQLEQGAEALFRQVDAANAARHTPPDEFISVEGVQQ
jgi:outer membrane murein-binding lipoprotein Lpp